MKPIAELLESRRLLAGVTLLTHGQSGNITGWIESAAEAIQARMGGVNAASIYVLEVEGSGLSVEVNSFEPEEGQKDYRQTTSGEIIIKLDWTDVDDGLYSTGTVAKAVSEYFLESHGSLPPLAQLPLHAIGHSRGASLVTALVQNLGEAGVWVDHMTSLDPHPVDGVNDYQNINLGDTKMATYDNVFFADNYWRTDGNTQNLDFDGEPVAGAHQGNLTGIVTAGFFGSAHMQVTAYYEGTIDLNADEGGDARINDDWYGNTAGKPARDETGFAFARIGNETRPSDGVSSLLGGAGLRIRTDEDGSQWGNAFSLSTLNGTSFSAGGVIQTKFQFVDRDTSARTSIYIDKNQNPYDSVSLLTGKTLTSDSVINGRIDVPTTGLKGGTYYLAVQTDDGDGHVRWSYLRTPITLAEPNFASVASGKLTVNGTDGNDKLVMHQTSTNIVLTLNGAQQVFSNTEVQTIEVYANSGNDSVDASAMTSTIYVNAGPGQDVVYGGGGNDTLSGGAQSNTLNGGLGDDVLNGSAGNDSLIGAGGYDRLYSNGGLDTLDGGANVDRLFGDAGNELMIGGKGNDKIYSYGGNDTLLGQADSDILDGGDGTDTADSDPNDILTSIELFA